MIPIQSMYIAPLQDNYSETLPTQPGGTDQFSSAYRICMQNMRLRQRQVDDSKYVANVAIVPYIWISSENVFLQFDLQAISDGYLTNTRAVDLSSAPG